MTAGIPSANTNPKMAKTTRISWTDKPGKRCVFQDTDASAVRFMLCCFQGFVSRTYPVSLPVAAPARIRDRPDKCRWNIRSGRTVCVSENHRTDRYDSAGDAHSMHTTPAVAIQPARSARYGRIATDPPQQMSPRVRVVMEELSGTRYPANAGPERYTRPETRVEPAVVDPTSCGAASNPGPNRCWHRSSGHARFCGPPANRLK